MMHTIKIIFRLRRKMTRTPCSARSGMHQADVKKKLIIGCIHSCLVRDIRMIETYN